MRTVRFYDIMIDCLESNGEYTTKQISDEFKITVPVDSDLNEMFDVLTEKTGQEVCSFRYEDLV